MKAVLAQSGVCIIESVDVADTFTSRFLGLMGRKTLRKGCGLYIAPCGSIHTFFMRFDLDLVFLGAGGRVVKVARNVTPFRLVFGGSGATSVLEMAAGWLAEGSVKPGDVVAFDGETTP